MLGGVASEILKVNRNGERRKAIKERWSGLSSIYSEPFLLGASLLLPNALNNNLCCAVKSKSILSLLRKSKLFFGRFFFFIQE